MAYMKETSYFGIAGLIDRSRNGKAKLGNNTYAVRSSNSSVIVTLHGHVIAELFSDYHDHVKVTLAGWPTVTTRDRINQFIPDGYKAIQRDHEQYLWCYYGTDLASRNISIDSTEWLEFKDGELVA